MRDKMKGKIMAKHTIPPCPKCPYKLGQVKTTINPCPQCKLNDYNAYDRFISEPHKDTQQG